MTPIAAGISQRQVQVTQKTEMFEGPLPHPDILVQYNAIQAGFADRIIQMAENEAKHRHTLETKVIESTFDEGKRGQLYGLLIGSLAIVCGTVAAMSGNTVAGSIIGGGGVVALVSVFVLGRVLSPENKDNQE
jgi:uncharacterized membrane protein